jgi:hypothetical protein
MIEVKIYLIIQSWANKPIRGVEVVDIVLVTVTEGDGHGAAMFEQLSLMKH